MLTKYGKQMTYEDLRIMVNEEQIRRGGGLKSFLCSLVIFYILVNVLGLWLGTIILKLRIPVLIIVGAVVIFVVVNNLFVKLKMTSLLAKAGNQIEKAKQAVVDQVEAERKKAEKGEA